MLTGARETHEEKKQIKRQGHSKHDPIDEDDSVRISQKLHVIIDFYQCHYSRNERIDAEAK